MYQLNMNELPVCKRDWPMPVQRYHAITETFEKMKHPGFSDVFTL